MHYTIRFNHAIIGYISIRMEYSVYTVLHRRKLFANHILEIFSSYRTNIQIIKYFSTQQSLLLRIGLLMFKLSNGLLPETLNELYI